MKRSTKCTFYIWQIPLHQKKLNKQQMFCNFILQKWQGKKETSSPLNFKATLKWTLAWCRGVNKFCGFESITKIETIKSLTKKQQQLTISSFYRISFTSFFIAKVYFEHTKPISHQQHYKTKMDKTKRKEKRT
jgi:2,3-bisphosphoglycerate-independent phosphoglycerate mutase